MAVARSRVLAGSPHHVGRCGRRSIRSAGLIAYQLVSLAFLVNFSTAVAPPTSRRKSRKIGTGSSQCPSPSMTGWPSLARIAAEGEPLAWVMGHLSFDRVGPDLLEDLVDVRPVALTQEGLVEHHHLELRLRLGAGLEREP